VLIESIINDFIKKIKISLCITLDESINIKAINLGRKNICYRQKLNNI